MKIAKTKDFRSKANLGYAFINLVDEPKAGAASARGGIPVLCITAGRFSCFGRSSMATPNGFCPARRLGHRGHVLCTEGVLCTRFQHQVCSVSWSGPHQGQQAHIDRYRPWAIRILCLCAHAFRSSFAPQGQPHHARQRSRRVQAGNFRSRPMPQFQFCCLPVADSAIEGATACNSKKLRGNCHEAPLVFVLCWFVLHSPSFLKFSAFLIVLDSFPASPFVFSCHWVCLSICARWARKGVSSGQPQTRVLQ